MKEPKGATPGESGLEQRGVGRWALGEALKLGARLRREQPRRGRYAPSPTGPLHLGNIQAALCAWASARLQGAPLILRVEDLDRQRSRPRHERAMLEDLAWLGLDFDEGPSPHDEPEGPCAPYRQSQRVGLYEDALRALKERGRVYPCFCTRREIKAAARRSSIGEMVYAGTCRNLGERRLAELRAERGEPAWRLKLGARRVVRIVDGLKGELTQDVTEEVGDFILKRRDGVFAYQLAVVVDDAAMGVGEVVRGEDLFLSAPRQVALWEELGVRPPRFVHVPLVRDERGVKLSKRERAFGVRALAEQGWSPERVIGELARGLGWVERAGEVSLLEALDSAKGKI